MIQSLEFICEAEGCVMSRNLLGGAYYPEVIQSYEFMILREFIYIFTFTSLQLHLYSYIFTFTSLHLHIYIYIFNLCISHEFITFTSNAFEAYEFICEVVGWPLAL